MIKRILSRIYKVPYLLKDEWLAAYISFGYTLVDGCKVSNHAYSANCGEVVPLFSNKTYIYYYKIMSWKKSSGSDHIVSGRKFNLKFHKREKKTNDQN